MATWQGRLRDAHNFFEVAEAVNDQEHGNQAASNAILATIAANDAICLFLAQQQPSGKSHTEAARILQEACKGTRWEQEAPKKARQLVGLIHYKNAAQYRGEALSQQVVDRIMQQAERFIEWAAEIVQG